MKEEHFKSVSPDKLKSRDDLIQDALRNYGNPKGEDLDDFDREIINTR